MDKYIEYLKERKFTQLTDWKVKAFDLAIEAMGKQMLKKPIRTFYEERDDIDYCDKGYTYTCPCYDENEVGRYSDELGEWIYKVNYCSECGQKLDWN